jgi:hypothetical protein
MIDTTAFGKNLKAITLRHQLAHIKFIHNQLPLGYQQSPVKDANLKLCPTCRIPSILFQGSKPETLSNMQITSGKHPSYSALSPDFQPSNKHKNHA